MIFRSCEKTYKAESLYCQTIQDVGKSGISTCSADNVQKVSVKSKKERIILKKILGLNKIKKRRLLPP